MTGVQIPKQSTSAGVVDLRTPSARRQRRTIPVWLLRTVCWGGLIVLWELAAAQLGSQTLPSFTEILTEGVPRAIEKGYYAGLLTTLRQLAIGFGLASVAAVLVGIIMGRSIIFRDFLWPFVNGLYVTPQQALLPLFIILFGSGLQFRAVVVGLFCFYFPLVNTVVGVQSVNQSYLDATSAFCTPSRRMLWVLWLPATLGHIVAGLRLGFGMALTAMILAELWVIAGTGGVLTDLGEAHELSTYYALVFAITAIAVAGNQALYYLELWSRRWETQTNRSSRP